MGCTYWQGWLTYRGTQGTLLPTLPICTSPPLVLPGAPCCPPGSENPLCCQLTLKKLWV